MWTNWEEFLPEHVYASQGRLFVIDPKGKDMVLGLPQIDLAMFSVLCSDVYKLPSGEKGEIILKNLSDKISVQQGLSQRDAGILWLLGRAMQYSLSSRFRIDKELERAVEYGSKSASVILELERILFSTMPENIKNLQR